jgi:hypothetical protein
MNLSEILEQRGIAYRRSGDEVNVCCPFCTGRGETTDTRFRLGINTQSNLAYCFNCGWASRFGAQAFLRRMKVAADLSITTSAQEAEPEPVHLPEDFHVLDVVRDDLDARAMCYLRDRGILPEQIKKYGIGASFSGRYGYRLIFPVRFRGELRGFVARDFTGTQERRYLNSFGKGKGVFGLWDDVEGSTVALFEGVFKALRGQQVVGGCCGAVLGNVLTQEQAELLTEAGCRAVYLWPDPDPAGLRGARRSAIILERRGIEVRVVWPSVMADEASLEEIRSVWEEKTRQVDFDVVTSWRMRLWEQV